MRTSSVRSSRRRRRNLINRLVASLCLLAMAATMLPPRAVAQPTTKPSFPDTDGDGFWDGPDTWETLPDGQRVLHIGEDKNGNGKYEPKGADGILGTADDESDPNNRNSFPSAEALAAIDSDGDGLTDAEEIKLGTDPSDADTDDDGVSDGDEVKLYHTNPLRADTDNDGLPDGFELGLTYSVYPSTSPYYGLNDYNRKFFKHIDRVAVYRFYFRNDPDHTHFQKSFLPAPSAGYRSDPRSYDSNFNGVWDADELDAGADPMRGLVRGKDLEFQLDDLLDGFAPVNKEYQIYLNYVTDDAGDRHWQAVLPICLGQSTTQSLTLAAHSVNSAIADPQVFVSGENYVSSLTITESQTETYKNRYQIAYVTLRTASDIPAFRIDLSNSQGTFLHSYPVGLNRYYLDYPEEYFPDGDPPQIASLPLSPRWPFAGIPVGLPGRFSVFLTGSSGGGMQGVNGAGFIDEEGELLSNQVWQNDDWITLAMELVTATAEGTITFNLASIGVKYALSVFFNFVSAPLEFWLQFVSFWRDQTLLDCPEEFRTLTGAIMDKRVDVGWIMEHCEDLSTRKGWFAVYPTPFAYDSENTKLSNLEGGFAPDLNPDQPNQGDGGNQQGPGGGIHRRGNRRRGCERAAEGVEVAAVRESRQPGRPSGKDQWNPQRCDFHQFEVSWGERTRRVLRRERWEVLFA